MAERHLGSKGTVPEGSSIDLDDIIAKNPCHMLYMALEDCLVETNRNWKSCQLQVKQLKECSTQVAKQGVGKGVASEKTS